MKRTNGLWLIIILSVFVFVACTNDENQIVYEEDADEVEENGYEEVADEVEENGYEEVADEVDENGYEEVIDADEEDDEEVVDEVEENGYYTLDEIETIWVMSSYPHYGSISHLASYATDVVRVEVLDERVDWLNAWLEPPQGIDPYELYTVHRIRVLDVFQGDAAIGDILEVRQIGGEQDDLRVINEDKVPLEVGDDLVLFLRASLIENLPSILLNPNQSAYYFTAENEALESVNPENDLVLTMEDLSQILEYDSIGDD